MDEIKEYIDYTVKRTIHELKKSGALRSNDSVCYEETSRMLYNYYNSGEENAEIKQALEAISSDEYAQIIPLYYGQGMTIDTVALELGVDVSTIVRNKRRLCLDICTTMGRG